LTERPAAPRAERKTAPVWREFLPLVGVVALAAVLNTWALAQNGYANVYYSAGVKSMLQSWHNFFFVSADPAGLISIDKPPLGLWLQAASAEVFGFQPLSLLLPEAILGVVTVAALYAIMRRRFGVLAATVAALTLAVFPSFVAVSRDNNVDTLLILFMTLACGTALRATETGRLRWLIGSGVLVALAFNTKALAAYLIVPGIAVAYAYCAPGSIRRRITHLAIAGAVCGVLSIAWMAAVDLTPSGHRPFVGSSTANSEFQLAFVYNGAGRVGGQAGGPGAVVNLGIQPESSDPAASLSTGATSLPALHPAPKTAPKLKETINANPVAFGESPGPFRLFRTGLGDQGAWLLAFAFIGLLAMALTRPARRDPRCAALIVFGGFFLFEVLFLSTSKGIVHPYYVSALGPGTAAMVGGGVAAMVRPAVPWHRVLLAVAVALAVVVQVLLLHQAHYLKVWSAILIPAAAITTLVAVLVARWSRASLAVVVGLLLVAPTAYAATTWRRPVEGTFPAAGPRVVPGNGGAELSRAQLATDDALIDYVLSHHPGTRYQLLTEASLTADSPILLGVKAVALGGYGGVDPAMDGPQLGRLVAAGQARYVLLGGGYSYRGGNKASTAAALACPEVPLQVWRGGGATSDRGLYLVDCGGRTGQLAAQPR
jgi:4-amino-4-deoxy-L-arabinose transferase-like glycosyltransferase